jgi:phosphopantothenoylcysteine decarboxylase/phosphopantothenate--cysteine ligase
MPKLRSKKILLGITAGIAAYKSISLLRLLVKEGADVQVVMTPDATAFVTPLTLSALSGKPVLYSFYNKENGEWHRHVELAETHDLFLICPLTANTLAKMANGTCDNFLLSCYFSFRKQVIVAPAMDLEMYQHPSVKRNITQISEDGVFVIPATSGFLASGLEGHGRMEEPEEILKYVIYQAQDKDLQSKTVLVNAGPTREFIDPVRYIGNLSSGKMGLAIARELACRGATVHLVMGPVSIDVNFPGVNLREVQTADEMFKETVELFDSCDAAILSAAVADFSPKETATEKMKKGEKGELAIHLHPTKDILKSLGAKKGSKILFGFALETNNEIEHAKHKLKSKNADVIVLNSLQDEGAGFGGDTNKVHLLENDSVTSYPLMNKIEVAKIIVDKLATLLC